MTTFYCPTYFCNFCEREFEVGNRYHNEEETFNKAKELMYHKAVHICDNGEVMRIVLLASIILQAIAIGMSFAENIGEEKQRIIRYTGWFLLLIYMIFG